jgi:hypothetical protein
MHQNKNSNPGFLEQEFWVGGGQKCLAMHTHAFYNNLQDEQRSSKQTKLGNQCKKWQQ